LEEPDSSLLSGFEISRGIGCPPIGQINELSCVLGIWRYYLGEGE
jgi:hypothetical protein